MIRTLERLRIMPDRTPFVILASLATAGCFLSQPTWHGGPSSLGAYRQSYVDAVGDEFTASVARAELLAEIAAKKVLWIGDHHRDSRLHGLQSELLVQVLHAGMPLALGLECVGTADQADLDEFVAGDIELKQLEDRMRARWDGSWLDDRSLDPWHYRWLLAFAKNNQLPVFALEPTPRLPLAERDPVIAQSVADAAARWPEHTLVVVVGQTHLLGNGNLAGRTGLDGVLIGAQPTAPLRAASAPRAGRGELLRSNGGVYWFTEMLGGSGTGSVSR
jgi:hypothetical protein